MIIINNEPQNNHQMIQVKNIQVFRNVPFDQYLEMPGWSHSSIKLNGVTKTQPTKKMMLGTDVHHYLHEPEKYNHSNIDIVRPAAKALKKQIGDLWQYLECEVCITADFIFDGMVLKYKGRIDEVILKRLGIDIKVSSMPLQKSVPYFGYDEQQTGYWIASQARAWYIIRVDPESCKPGRTPVTQIYNVKFSPDWWIYQIKQKGTPI